MPATVLDYVLHNERDAAQGHPTLTDVINRPLKSLLTRSGYDSAAAFTGLYGPVFNVKAYGAVADDATDATAAIQAAITAAGSAGVTCMPPGTYRTTSPLLIPDGARVIGAGSRLTIIHNIATNGVAKDSGATAVYDVQLSGFAVHDNNTGTSTTVGFDLTAFARGQFSDLIAKYKQTGFLFKVNGGGGACYYNKSRALIAWDTKIGFDFDTALSVNANKFADTEVMRTAGTWDAGGGEVGIRLSGVGNHFSRTYISASGATSRALQFLPSPAANSHNIFANGLYIESQPTTDIDATDTASPNFVDDFLCDGRPSPIILDNNLNLTYRTAAASVTLNGVAGKPAHQWARSILANGSGLGARIGYTAFYPPSSGADPTVPTPLAGALHYRTDLNKLRVFNGTAWETVTSA